MVWQTFDLNPIYEVSDLGEVRRADNGYVLKPSTTHNGYLYVQLWANGKGRNWRLNRLVLITFTGLDPDPKKVQVAHVNGNRIDNRLDNLAWKDPRGNYLDRIEHGTQVCISTHNQKLTPEDRAVMRNFYANGQTATALADRFNCSVRHVRTIVAGSRWTKVKK